MAQVNKITTSTFNTMHGELVLGSFNDKLCLCDWKYRTNRERIDQRVQSFFNAQYEEGKSEVVEKTIEELKEYFVGQLEKFTVPIALAGSPFQMKVWNQLLAIPYGKTTSYSQLSFVLKNSKGIRAVANANGANAISIIVPCHRVIGADGSMTGYAGGIKTKKNILIMEGALNGKQIDLFPLF